MLSTSLIIDNLKEDEKTEYKKLCKLLKISKKTDKYKLNIALDVLEKLEIIRKTENNEFLNIKDEDHIIAKIRCSSKGYCFAVRDNSSEDIYIKENLLNYAWNGDKVLVRVIKEGVRRRSPEGIVDCILDRENKILLAKVQIINEKVYGIPIDDRILSKIKLPLLDKKYLFKPEEKNIVKIQIDMFPIGQLEGSGHVIKELKLTNDEQFDDDFVLSKNNLNIADSNITLKINEPEIKERLDLSQKNSFMFKSWQYNNSPIMPLFQVEINKNGESKLWIHSASIAERLDLSDKNIIDFFNNNFETFTLSNNGWKSFLSNNILKAAEFKIGKKKEAISLCILLTNEMDIKDWSFHLTYVTCSEIIGNKHLEALIKNTTKSRITSRILKPIKDYIKEIDFLLEISKNFRLKQILRGKIEIPKEKNNINILNEFFIHKPADYKTEYLEPINSSDIQTYISPLLFEADSIWHKHSKSLNLQSLSYNSNDINHLNVNELIKQTQLIDHNFELDENGTLTLKNLYDNCKDDNKKRIINKYLINTLKNNKARLINNTEKTKESLFSLAPWTLPSYDFINLINQYNIFNLYKNGKRSIKGIKEVDILKKNSSDMVKWEIHSAINIRLLNLLFNEVIVDKYNSFTNKIESYKSNIISLKKIREAEKLIGKKFKGLIITVQSYGFFVEIPELFIEGLVHVSTLNDDWYEYRSRQNLLVGRKSKNTFRVGDIIDIKIVKIDILKYQIDLEIS